MAFNPFESLRKNSRVMMAGLAILCMFLFVFSSGVGRGDVLDIFADWAGGSGRIPTAVTVEGRKYNLQQIQDIQTRRRVADRYLREASAAAHMNILVQVSQELNKFDPSVRQFVEQYMQFKVGTLTDPNRFLPVYRMLYLDQRGNRFLEILPFVSQADGPNKTTHTNLIRQLALMLEHDRAFYAADRQPNDLYFGGRADNLSDTADFLAWKHEADRLGIRFTDAEIKSFVTRELMNNLTDKADAEISQIMRQQFRGFSPELLFAALADEYAVQAAQTALTGSSQTAVPAVVTPDEAWDWFKDVRTTVRVGLIEVPVASFLDQVKGQPTEAELKALYDKYRAEEYNPARDEPGFKEPRKIRVDWFEVPAEPEYHRKLAEQVAPLQLALARLAFATPTGESGGLGYLHQLALALSRELADAPLSAEYARYVRDDGTPWTDSYGFGRRGGLHDTSVVTAEGIAEALATGAASGPLAAAQSLESAAIRREMSDRTRLGTTAVLAAAVDPLAVPGLWIVLKPEPMPVSAVAPLLAKKLADDTRERVLAGDLQQFQKEVAERLKLSDKSNVQAYMSEFIHQRGFKRGTTTEPRDVFDIVNDPGLQPLKDSFAGAHGSTDPFLRDLAQAFFSERAGLFAPQSFPGRGGTQYYFWRTEDREPRSQPFDKVRSRVEAAWREQQARELARQAAEALAKDAQTLNGDEQKLRDLALQRGKRSWIEVKPQAKLNPVIDPLANRTGRPYAPYTVPEEQVRYPLTMGPTLIDLRAKPIGTAVVVSDQPKDHFFVAVLLGKAEPLVDEFRRSYAMSMSMADADPLLRQLRQEKREQYRKDILAQLRKDLNVAVQEPKREDSK